MKTKNKLLNKILLGGLACCSVVFSSAITPCSNNSINQVQAKTINNNDNVKDIKNGYVDNGFRSFSNTIKISDMTQIGLDVRYLEGKNIDCINNNATYVTNMHYIYDIDKTFTSDFAYNTLYNDWFYGSVDTLDAINCYKYDLGISLGSSFYVSKLNFNLVCPLRTSSTDDSTSYYTSASFYGRCFSGIWCLALQSSDGTMNIIQSLSAENLKSVTASQFSSSTVFYNYINNCYFDFSTNYIYGEDCEVLLLYFSHYSATSGFNTHASCIINYEQYDLMYSNYNDASAKANNEYVAELESTYQSLKDEYDTLVNVKTLLNVPVKCYSYSYYNGIDNGSTIYKNNPKWIKSNDIVDDVLSSYLTTSSSGKDNTFDISFSSLASNYADSSYDARSNCGYCYKFNLNKLSLSSTNSITFSINWNHVETSNKTYTYIYDNSGEPYRYMINYSYYPMRYRVNDNSWVYATSDVEDYTFTDPNTEIEIYVGFSSLNISTDKYVNNAWSNWSYKTLAYDYTSSSTYGFDYTLTPVSDNGIYDLVTNKLATGLLDVVAPLAGNSYVLGSVRNVDYNNAWYDVGYNQATKDLESVYDSRLASLEKKINDLNNTIDNLNNTNNDLTQKNADLSNQLVDITKNNFSWASLFNAIAFVPFQALSGVLNFEIFGINLFALFGAILTTLLLVWIIKKVI